MDSKNEMFVKTGRNLLSYADFTDSIFTERKGKEENTNESKQKENRGYRKIYQNIE